MSKRDRQLAEKVIALLERLKFAVRDPDFPQAKLDALQSSSELTRYSCATTSLATSPFNPPKNS